MKIIESKEFENDKFYKKIFMLNDNIQLNSLIGIIKKFENENDEMSICHCNTYDVDGSQLYRLYTNVDQIKEFEKLPSPYGNFSIDFQNRHTKNYSFSLVMSINSKDVLYIINKKKLSGLTML